MCHGLGQYTNRSQQATCHYIILDRLRKELVIQDYTDQENLFNVIAKLIGINWGCIIH